jgi:hypothetical protein
LRSDNTYEVFGMGNIVLSPTNTHLTIPAEHNGRPVTRIETFGIINVAEQEMFANLKTITIPDSIAGISYFASLTLQRTDLAASFARGEIIYAGNWALDVQGHSHADWATAASGGVLTFRPGTVGIADWVAVDRLGSAITSVVFPDTFRHIGAHSLRGGAIASLVIPASVVSIGNNAFENNQLTSLTLNEGLVSIGERAFNNAFRAGNGESGRYTVVIPLSVTTIGERAFTWTPGNTTFFRLLVRWETRPAAWHSDWAAGGVGYNIWILRE